MKYGSTTGASILTNVEIMPKSLLFWRALTQWLGGMGVLVFAIALLPGSDKMSTALAKAEIPGPQFGKLVSKLRFTSRILYAIYIVLTLLLVIILCCCKMPVFDSFCHAFSTASTGGFSVKNASIAAYNSVSIEVVLTIFMMIFAVNFNIYFMILIGQFLKAIRSEVRGECRSKRNFRRRDRKSLHRNRRTNRLPRLSTITLSLEGLLPSV